MFEDLVHFTFKALAEVPDFHRAIEEIRRVDGCGRVTEETSYAVMSLSPQEAGAMTRMWLMRTAYVSMLLSRALDFFWHDNTPLTERA